MQLCMQLCILLPFVSSTYQVSVLSLYTSFNFFNITWKWPLTDWKSIITFCSAHCYRLLNQTNPLLMTARNHLLSKTDCVPLRLLARSEMFCRAREFNFFSMGDKFIFLMSQLTAIFGYNLVFIYELRSFKLYRSWLLSLINIFYCCQTTQRTHWMLH